ncbi:hypothetical protein EDD16DRAFT_1462462, partial [Pisolithus croceorrhizus]
ILTKCLGLDSQLTTLRHIQHGGWSCALDPILPTLQDMEAVKVVLEATPDTLSYMINVREDKITHVPLMEVVEL